MIMKCTFELRYDLVPASATDPVGITGGPELGEHQHDRPDGDHAGAVPVNGQPATTGSRTIVEPVPKQSAPRPDGPGADLGRC